MSLSNSSLVQSHIYKRFNLIKKVGSGAYGHVWKVQQKTTKKIFALKKIFDAFQHATDAQRTYREIQILKQTNHTNIVKLHETLKANNGKDVYLVFQYMESDLHNVISSDILKDIHVRFIIYQVARALKYLHSGYVIHRDLKPSNILVNSDCVIKLCDFGLVRSIWAKQDSGPVLTEGVATRWYRAPEVLLGSRAYSTPADVWSFGCIIYEILARKPLFAGSSTMDQVEKLCHLTGSPSEQDIKSLNSQSAESMLSQIKLPTSHIPPLTSFEKFAPQLSDLLSRMIVFNPARRITVDEILRHDCVKMFNKPQDDLLSKQEFVLKVDDNKKLTVQEYRQMIYTQASNSVVNIRGESTGITKSSSLKVIRRTADVTGSFNAKNFESKTFGSVNKQLTKNRSFHTFKTVTQVKNQSSVSFLTSIKTQQGQNLTKYDKTITVEQAKVARVGFNNSSNNSKEVKWSPNFIVSKSPIRQQKKFHQPNTQGFLLQPSFNKEQIKPQIEQIPGLNAKNSSTFYNPNKDNRPLHSPTNFVTSKYFMPTNASTVKKQIPNRSSNFTNTNDSFKSSIKKYNNGGTIALKDKIGKQKKCLSFQKQSTQIQDSNLSVWKKKERIASIQQSNEKVVNPENQKAFKSYHKFPSTLPAWNSPKGLNNKKEGNVTGMKTKPSYFNSQKYIKPSSLVVVNPQTRELTQNEMQKVD